MNNCENLDPTISASLTSPESTPTKEVTVRRYSIRKTARDQFFNGIVKNEKNWSAKCLLCGEVVLDNLGVTSNINRHVKTHHKTEFDHWSKQLNESNQSQPKLDDFFSNKNQPSSCLKRSYPSDHQRQQQLQNAIVHDLIIDLGLPLSLVESPEFLRFMNTIDSKFSVISRRNLSRKTIPILYNKMNDSLKQFCSTAEFISLTLDIWTDRRMRPFFSITGMNIFSSSRFQNNFV